MTTGLILKNENGYFLADTQTGIQQCRSRKKTKRQNNILVGDTVQIDDDNMIAAIAPRKTTLTRPAASNIDELLLVSSIKHPDFQSELMNRMILLAEYHRIQPIICITKSDLNPDEAQKWKTFYQSVGYESFCLSLSYSEGWSLLRNALQSRITAAAGPSGAGKSTLLNHVTDTNQFHTQSVSSHNHRGKATTRHAELLRWRNDQYIMDTPGFTLLDTENIPLPELGSLFIDFAPFLGKCRFHNCQHVNEPGCAVKEAVSEGKIMAQRYEFYLKMHQEIKDMKVKY
jgi:ribosome biogenesis GTPase